MGHSFMRMTSPERYGTGIRRPPAGPLPEYYPCPRLASVSAGAHSNVGAVNFWVTYPLIKHPYNPAFMTKGALTRFCAVAEASGFAGIGFTDHPAPTDRWLRAGGHDALDPFAALSFCAAVTERMRLIPNIVVLPYRNPFLVAKLAATLDALSGGRFTLAVATGYLRGEYQALGVDFERRNELFDEAIEVILGIWSENDFAHQGAHFTAKGQTANPKPDPRPPIWIGGNSRQSLRRVARFGDGWSPFPAPRVLAATAKTPPLESVEDLRAMLGELLAIRRGRGTGPDEDRRVVRLRGRRGSGQREVRSRRPAGRHRRVSPARGHLVRHWRPG